VPDAGLWTFTGGKSFARPSTSACPGILFRLFASGVANHRRNRTWTELLQGAPPISLVRSAEPRGSHLYDEEAEHKLTPRDSCVKMSNMKTTTVRHVQHNLAEVLSWVDRGEEVLVYRRRTLVARLVPPVPAPAEAPDFIARARSVWGEKPRGKRLSQIASQARGDR